MRNVPPSRVLQQFRIFPRRPWPVHLFTRCGTSIHAPLARRSAGSTRAKLSTTGTQVLSFRHSLGRSWVPSAKRVLGEAAYVTRRIYRCVRGRNRGPLAGRGSLPTSGAIHCPGQSDRRSRLRALQSRQLPGLLQGVRRSSRLVQDVGRHTRHQQSAVLEMVRRRPNQRQLQLRRSPSRQTQEQDGDPLRPRAGARGHPARHLSGALRAGKRGRRAVAGLLRSEEGRPSDAAHAHGGRASDHDARLRQTRCHSLAGLQRLQRQGHGGSHRRFREPRADHDGRLLPRRQTPRSQGESGHRRRRSGKGGRRGSRRCSCGRGTRARIRAKRRWSRAATSS